MSAARNWANTLAHTSRHCAPKPCGTSPSLVTGIWPLTNRMRWASDTSSACEYQPTGGGASSELINRFFIELPSHCQQKGRPEGRPFANSYPRESRSVRRLGRGLVGCGGGAAARGGLVVLLPGGGRPLCLVVLLLLPPVGPAARLLSPFP